MSRRPAGQDRTMQNQQTLKSLVKLEGNKSCADCKKNKHPRWASWNLGIFICIRCSGIHRGMGTHISKVKSVDLDSWTDEQMQSMLMWGNTRANKYWEAKLAPGHVPAEAKIENFIRTKYDSKRWSMDGPVPDPATLGGGESGDDDVPLNVVQEKAKLDRSASLRNASMSSSPSAAPAPLRSAAAPVIDLFGDDPTPVRASTAEPSITARAPPPPQQQQQRAPAPPPKQTRPGDSLLGLDFFGSSQAAPPARPLSAASGASTPGSNPRSDLKQSILSLYASAPKPAAQPASNAFGAYSSPSLQSSTTSTSSFGAMADAFGGLNFGSSAAPPQQQQQAAKPSVFSNFTSPTAQTSSLSGGSFFDTKPALPLKQTAAPAARPQAARVSSGFGDFGDFTSAPSPAPVTSPVSANPGMGDLFDMSASAQPGNPATSTSSAFNLSSPAQQAKPAPVPAMSGFDNMDAWGSSNAWSSNPEPAVAAVSAPAPPSNTSYNNKAPAMTSVSNDDDFGGWGSNEGTSAKSKITQDDDFGGWSSAPAPAAASVAPAHHARTTSSGGGGGGAKAPAADDLFGNVWG